MSFKWLSSTVFVHMIEGVRYREDQMGKKMLKWGEKEEKREKRVEMGKNIVKQEEYEILRKITKVPRIYLDENQEKIAGYR